MRRALARLGVTPDHVLVDGNPIRSLGVEHTAVVGGDACCHSIACASIVAKVTRDRLMRLLAVRYPGYGWERNAGYATRDHVAGLQSLGLTPFHRRTYQRIRRMLEGEQLAMDLDTTEDTAETDPLADGGPMTEDGPMTESSPIRGDGFLQIRGAKGTLATLPR